MSQTELNLKNEPYVQDIERQQKYAKTLRGLFSLNTHSPKFAADDYLHALVNIHHGHHQLVVIDNRESTSADNKDVLIVYFDANVPKESLPHLNNVAKVDDAIRQFMIRVFHVDNYVVYVTLDYSVAGVNSIVFSKSRIMFSDSILYYLTYSGAPQQASRRLDIALNPHNELHLTFVNPLTDGMSYSLYDRVMYMIPDNVISQGSGVVFDTTLVTVSTSPSRVSSPIPSTSTAVIIQHSSDPTFQQHQPNNLHTTMPVTQMETGVNADSTLSTSSNFDPIAVTTGSTSGSIAVPSNGKPSNNTIQLLTSLRNILTGPGPIPNVGLVNWDDIVKSNSIQRRVTELADDDANFYERAKRLLTSYNLKNPYCFFEGTTDYTVQTIVNRYTLYPLYISINKGGKLFVSSYMNGSKSVREILSLLDHYSRFIFNGSVSEDDVHVDRFTDVTSIKNWHDASIKGNTFQQSLARLRLSLEAHYSKNTQTKFRDGFRAFTSPKPSGKVRFQSYVYSVFTNFNDVSDDRLILLLLYYKIFPQDPISVKIHDIYSSLLDLLTFRVFDYYYERKVLASSEFLGLIRTPVTVTSMTDLILFTLSW